MDNLPRFFFYVTGLILVSSSLILFTSELLPLVNDTGTRGLIVLLGYGFCYMNIVLVSSRRFMRRLDGSSVGPYLLGFIVFLPPACWVFIYEAIYGSALFLFLATLMLACGAGAYAGHKIGLKAQIKFQEQIRKYLARDGRLPEELQRPHDQLNKN
ncbi:MAG: hypothetical protein AAFW89_00025 [Bacteroidota bacterium]